jgi:hypothetical protein
VLKAGGGTVLWRSGESAVEGEVSAVGSGVSSESNSMRLHYWDAVMAKIIKVRCTGLGEHENEIDLEDVIGSDVVIYGGPITTGRDLPARIVRRCAVCEEGKVIVTREMIEQVL